MPKRGENIYKRQDGRWEGRYICGRKPDGRARYHSIYGKSYADVKAKLTAQKVEHEQRSLRGCDLTVKELFGRWLTISASCVKPSSYERYRFLIEKHILPQLGTLPVSCLTAEKLQTFLDGKRVSGRLDGKGGLSAKSVGDICVILKSALTLATAHYNYRDDGIVKQVKAPRCEAAKIKVYSPRETALMMEAVHAEPSVSGVSYLLSLELGLRLGEVCALRWSDIDFWNQCVRIERTALRLNRGGRTELVLQQPKTNASDRLIPLTPGLYDLLKSLRCAAPEDAFVLTGRTDRPMEPRTLQYRFRSFQKQLGICVRGYHSLRHSCATRCVDCGSDAKTIAAILCHASVTTTLQRYVHPTMEQQRRTLERASVCV